jgi:hypothetical protein
MAAKVHIKKVHMHQTTVRFGRDLWEVLELEAERLGVSAAQYVRDATLARLAYTAALNDQATASREAFEWANEAPPADGKLAQLEERVEAQMQSAAALQAQGKLARDKAERLRVEAEELTKRKATVRKR